MAPAVAPTAVERSPLIPSGCPIDFPSIDSNGGRLLRVQGPPIFPGWGAAYSVPTDERPCPICDEPVDTRGGSGGDNTVLVVPHEDGDPTHADLRWGHPLCGVSASGRDRIMYPRHSACVRCGGTLTDGSHTVGDGPARCADDEEWIHPTREDHAERRAAWLKEHQGRTA